MEKTKDKVITCNNCVMDSTDPSIKFNKDGICDFCTNFKNVIEPNWRSISINNKKVIKLVNKIKKSGSNKEYDCVIGMSGGVDSSYLAYIAKVKLGLRPLILSVDTGWNLNVANENVLKIIKKLNLDLETVVINWEEMKDLQLSFLKSQVPYQDLPQDHVIFAGLYNYAIKNKIKYILTGANFSTEGVKPPQEWTYLNDIKFIKSIQKKFGSVRLKTLPMVGMFKQRIIYRYIKGLRVIHPLNWIKYDKENALEELRTKFGWEKYENKHYENVFTRFYEGFWLPTKFGYDKRKCYFSNLILTNQITRTEAFEMLRKQPYNEKIAKQDLEYIADKLDLSVTQFIDIMNGQNKNFRDYDNNYKWIKFAIKLAKFVGLEKRNFR